MVWFEDDLRMRLGVWRGAGRELAMQGIGA